MKLWLQSGSALSSDASTPYGKRYEKSVARHMRAVARPDTVLESFGIESTPVGKVGGFLEACNGFSAGPVPVTRFTLFRSHLNRDGAHYEALADYPLTKA